MTPPVSARDYHLRTKHHLHRYAAGPRGLDWGSQPEPFRSFAGCARVELPLPADSGLPYAGLWQRVGPAPQPLNLQNLGTLLGHAFGLSAWKQYGYNRWALRCNPSSGNLHPTEAYVVVAGCAGIPDGVHHYLSRDHLLEQRCAATIALADGSLLLGISSIHWREAWKYGERAYRYCQHDAGHALAAVRFAAAQLGWRVRLLPDWSDAGIAAALGLDRKQDFGAAEPECADMLLLVSRNPDVALPSEACSRTLAQAPWQGRANVLSPHHLDDWPIIEQAAEACRKPETSAEPWRAAALPPPLPTDCSLTSAQVVMQRRSAQAFDGKTAISAQAFFRMLDMTLPRPGLPPFDAVAWRPRVHLALFVHRVDGLVPGLYFLLRDPDQIAAVRGRLKTEFEWAAVPGCPAHLPLYRLLAADARDAARAISCHQDIAADGAFSLGMLAEFDAGLAEGAWVYRELFWETGMIGQVLYLEAEAAGVQGTGIGCFFDDAMHELLGIADTGLQSLYHFTVGGALADARLQTLPPYAHLAR